MRAHSLKETSLKVRTSQTPPSSRYGADETPRMTATASLILRHELAGMARRMAWAFDEALDVEYLEELPEHQCSEVPLGVVLNWPTWGRVGIALSRG